MPLRTTQESSRPRASDRSVVDTPYNRRLAQSHARVTSSRLEAGATKMENNINQRLLGAHQKPASFMLVRGWKSSNSSPLPVEGEIFFLIRYRSSSRSPGSFHVIGISRQSGLAVEKKRHPPS